MEIYDEFGNTELLKRKKTAFLCSQQVPDNYKPKILDWANQCTKDDCIICGCYTQLERQVATQLILRGIPLIWIATNFDDIKKDIDNLREYVMQNRILILALFGPESTISTHQQSYMRNLAVLEHSDAIVVGYRTAESILDRQLIGYTITSEIIPQSEQHPFKSFIKLSNGSIILETSTQQDQESLRILQIEDTSYGQQRNIITLSSNDVLRLHYAIEQLIDNRKWEESRYAEIRKQYPNAFRPWLADDELLLRQLALKGFSDDEIAKKLGRQPSAIATRLQIIIEAENKKSEQP